MSVADPALVYPAMPRRGWSRVGALGRFTVGVGRRLDLPVAYRIGGDREIGWAGITLGHGYLAVSWR